ncbi:thrombopoietin receptor isoform X2 [Fundulus heteroclitus]|uniref:thrombopoietin receptor isoform X2 n=1 Tax=Fundulus heteroclitus TaxID=8078 RepID=UPI00165B01F8|nr:thrombopoietin receptor isoform X2 [Fundulus heteroclitus]
MMKSQTVSLAQDGISPASLRPQTTGHVTFTIQLTGLLDPPFNVSLQPGDNAGELKVSIETAKLKYIPRKEYRIRYSSMTHGEKTLEVRQSRNFSMVLGKNVLLISGESKKRDQHLPADLLVPGEEVVVQASVKCDNSARAHPGYWSAWSKPARAIVPVFAHNISLACFTSDLQNITCRWNSTKYGAENEYKLFYNASPRQSQTWTGWIKCEEDGHVQDTCSFRGDRFGKIKVKLNSTAAALKPSFLSDEFTLEKSIKSVPPSHLKGRVEKKRVCLEWEAPLPSLSSHLKYEVDIQIKGGENWTKTKLANPSMCEELPSGCEFSVKIRAKPDGSTYSGYWSDWSDVFSGVTPKDTDTLVIMWICVSMAVIVVSFVAAFFLHYRKLEQYFWPPVPNLEKVLQGFLMDINQQKWSPPVTAKQSFEETTSSVLDVISNDIPVLDKPSEESVNLLSSNGSFSSKEPADESSGSEVLRDYVTLNKDLTIVCLKENCYVYEEFKDGEDPETGNKLLKTCSCLKPCSCSNYFNRSYLLLAQSTDGFTDNISVGQHVRNPYTNVPLLGTT